jgi:hypothetical protein
MTNRRNFLKASTGFASLSLLSIFSNQSEGSEIDSIFDELDNQLQDAIKDKEKYPMFKSEGLYFDKLVLAHTSIYTWWKHYPQTYGVSTSIEK